MSPACHRYALCTIERTVGTALELAKHCASIPLSYRGRGSENAKNKPKLGWLNQEYWSPAWHQQSTLQGCPSKYPLTSVTSLLTFNCDLLRERVRCSGCVGTLR